MLKEKFRYLVWRVRFEVGWRWNYWHLKRSNIEVICTLPRKDEGGQA